MEKKTRQSGIELLRIIAIMGVVVLHYNNWSIGGGFRYVQKGSLNQYYLYLSQNMFVWAVDVFILISAYFLCTTTKRRFVKVFELILQVTFFRMLFYFLPIFLEESQFDKKDFLENLLLPKNWFVILYCALYIISPYINKLIDSLEKKDFQKLLITMGLLFSAWTIGVDFLEKYLDHALNGLSTVGMYGSQYGYTIVNFVLLYLIGAYLRKYEINISKSKLGAIIIIVYAINCILSIKELKMGLSRISTWNYNSPLLILLSIAIVLFAGKFTFSNKVINEMAKATFTCFLFHSYFMYRIPVADYVCKPVYVLMFHQLMVAVVIYLASYLVYKIYSLLTGWFIKLITPICDKVNISL